VEKERSTTYASEVNGLKEQVAGRDRVVIEVNSELERLRQQTTQLSADYQTATNQLQLALYEYVSLCASDHTILQYQPHFM